MNYTEDDYIVEVLKGNCKIVVPSITGFDVKQVTYEQWKVAQESKQFMRDYLKARLLKNKQDT